jgi:hypothetical protein
MTAPKKPATKKKVAATATKPDKPKKYKTAERRLPAGTVDRLKAAIKPKHPLMLDGKSWDKQKCIDILFNRIASSSKSMVTLLKEGHDGWPLPEYMTIRRWIDEDPALCEKYARVKEDQAEYMADEMMDIADEMPLTNPITGSLDSASVQHKRLRTETRKWLMGKLKPKKYGDKLDLNHTGNIGIESLIAGAGDEPG